MSVTIWLLSMCFAAGGALCVVCHAFDASHMVEDTLTCFHDIYHVSLKDKAAASTCYEVHANFVKNYSPHSPGICLFSIDSPGSSLRVYIQ